MGHRWSGACIDPVISGYRFLIRNLCRLVTFEQINKVLQGDIVQMALPGKWIPRLISSCGSGSEKMHGSLMNRLACLPKVSRNTIAVILSVALVCSTIPGPVFAAESAKKLFATVPQVRIDYIALVDWATLLPVEAAIPGTLFAIAAYVGKTRLIDNTILG